MERSSTQDLGLSGCSGAGKNVRLIWGPNGHPDIDRSCARSATYGAFGRAAYMFSPSCNEQLYGPYVRLHVGVRSIRPAIVGV